MGETWTSFRQRYLASQSNSLQLAIRLLRKKDPAAISAMLFAFGGLILSPLDALLARREARLYAASGQPARAIILVCGAPRSGTTLLAQYLINTLQVGYVNNLTSLFPSAPITAMQYFGRWAKQAPADYKVFYGRSRRLGGTNDGLHIWDRWLGSDRSKVTLELAAGSDTTMPQFFGALQQQVALPIVNKINKLVTCAHLVAPHLPNAHFVCLRRDPIMLAQSLLIARTDINGDNSRPYGVHQNEVVTDDPIEDVCRQVEFFEKHIQEQKSQLGNRFTIVQYEDFCENPASLITELTGIQGLDLQPRQDKLDNAAFEVSNSVRLPENVMTALKERLSVLKTNRTVDL